VVSVRHRDGDAVDVKVKSESGWGQPALLRAVDGGRSDEGVHGRRGFKGDTLASGHSACPA